MMSASAAVRIDALLPPSTASPIAARGPGTLRSSRPATSMPSSGGSGTPLDALTASMARPPATPQTKTHSRAKTGPPGAALSPTASQTAVAVAAIASAW